MSSSRHTEQPRPSYCGEGLLEELSSSGCFFTSFRVRKLILPNPQKALWFDLAKALNEFGSMEKASVCSFSVTLRLITDQSDVLSSGFCFLSLVKTVVTSEVSGM